MEPYIGEIQLFAGDFPPKNWLLCNGQLLSVAHYSALFSILGPKYGGNGQTTFALPDFRNHVGIGASNDYAYYNGAKGGEEKVILNESQISRHIHQIVMTDEPKVNVSSLPATQSIPTAGSSIAQPGFLVDESFASTMGTNLEVPDIELNANIQTTVFSESTGGGQPHNNMQPYIGMNFIICINGIYPSRW